MPPTGPQLVHAIKRNFGGLKEKDLDPEEIFWGLLPNDVDRPPDLENIPLDVSHSCHIFGVMVFCIRALLRSVILALRCILL